MAPAKSKPVSVSRLTPTDQLTDNIGGQLAESNTIPAKTQRKVGTGHLVICTYIRQTVRRHTESTRPTELRNKRQMWKTLLKVML